MGNQDILFKETFIGTLLFILNVIITLILFKYYKI